MRALEIVKALVDWIVGLIERVYRPARAFVWKLATVVKAEGRFLNYAIIARRGTAGILGWLIIFAVAAGFAIAFGLLFGVFNKIATDVNGTGIQIDQSFVSSVNTASSFASTGILIVLAIGVIGLAMVLIRVIAGMGAGR